MTREILFRVQDYSATYLQPGDSATLQELLEHCADYFELVYGLPPAATGAQELFAEKPPAKTLEDKFVIGFWDDAERLIGVLDTVRDYPQPGEWFVGLFLITPAYRQHGVGHMTYQVFERWVVQRGARQIGLGVVESNRRAYDFWQGLGFEVVEKRPPARYGNKDNVVIVMRRLLQTAVMDND